MLFRLFVAFCEKKSQLKTVTLTNELSYLEYLTLNAVSPAMLSNHLSALKAKFTIYGLNYQVLSHPKIQYFVKSVRIHKPVQVTRRSIIDQTTLHSMVSLCRNMYLGKVFKAIFLVAFFGLLRSWHSSLFIHLMLHVTLHLRT